MIMKGENTFAADGLAMQLRTSNGVRAVQRPVERAEAHVACV